MIFNVLIVYPDFKSEDAKVPELAYLAGIFKSQQINVRLVLNFSEVDLRWADKILISTYLYGHHNFPEIEKIVTDLFGKIREKVSCQVWVIGKLSRKMNLRAENLKYAPDILTFIPSELLNLDSSFCVYPYTPDFGIYPDGFGLGSIKEREKNVKSFSMLTSLGCFSDCTFCAVSEKFRPFSYYFLYEFLKGMKSKGYNHFVIEDDLFNAKRVHVDSFCSLLIEHEFNMTFECLNGLNVMSLDNELLLKLKKAGCVQLALGVETLSEETYRMLKKENFSLKHFFNVLKFCRSIKLNVVGYFLTEFSMKKCWLFPFIPIPILHFSNIDQNYESKLKQIFLYVLAYSSPYRFYLISTSFSFNLHLFKKIFYRLILILKS